VIELFQSRAELLPRFLEIEARLQRHPERARAFWLMLMGTGDSDAELTFAIALFSLDRDTSVQNAGLVE
jgi:hypothetical protein